jgi:hypothetical protein
MRWWIEAARSLRAWRSCVERMREVGENAVSGLRILSRIELWDEKMSE